MSRLECALILFIIYIYFVFIDNVFSFFRSRDPQHIERTAQLMCAIYAMRQEFLMREVRSSIYIDSI